MKEGLSPRQRVEFLFGQIRQNATAEDAYAALESYSNSISKKKRKESGRSSEQNTYQALILLPFVDSIKRSVQFDKEDMQGIDLTVFLLDEPISSVDVQVKSNDEDVKKFRDYDPQSGSFRQNGADLLARRGLIVLNGNTDERKIQKQFMRGLDRVISVQFPQVA